METTKEDLKDEIEIICRLLSSCSKLIEKSRRATELLIEEKQSLTGDLRRACKNLKHLKQNSKI